MCPGGTPYHIQDTAHSEDQKITLKRLHVRTQRSLSRSVLSSPSIRESPIDHHGAAQQNMAPGSFQSGGFRYLMARNKHTMLNARH